MKFSRLVVLTAACGSPNGPLQLGDDAAADGATDGTPDVPVTDPHKHGTVLITRNTDGSMREGASFIDASATGGLRVDGACVIRSSVTKQDIRVSAGDVTITDGTDSVTLSFGLTPIVGYQSQMQVYQPGDVLAVRADGATVPPFTGSVTFPPPITVTSPVPASPFVVETAGFSVAWSGAPRVRVAISQFPLDPQTNFPSLNIACDYTGTSASVSASSLENLVDANADIIPTVLTVSAIATDPVPAGDFNVEIAATNVGFVGTGFAN